MASNEIPSQSVEIARHRSLAAKYAGLASGYGSKLEPWLVIGNAAGLALVVSGFASGKIGADFQPMAAMSAWIFFGGIVGGFGFLFELGVRAEQLSDYHSQAADSLETNQSPPDEPKHSRAAALFFLGMSSAGFLFGVGLPLIEISLAILSGERLPTSGS